MLRYATLSVTDDRANTLQHSALTVHYPLLYLRIVYAVGAATSLSDPRFRGFGFYITMVYVTCDPDRLP